jgi:hypothetical protein
MMKNLGSWDRVARILLGLAILSLLLTDLADLRWLGVLGLIPIATALIGWCPAYHLFGIYTSPDEPRRRRRRT